MKRIVHVWAAIMIAASSWAADQGSSAPLREATSANRRFQLQIRPGRPGDSAIRGCKAGLYDCTGGRTRSRPRWERFLVNDVAPGRVFIRDDGRFVITLDEYSRGGARNALVIYGQHGELLRHFLLSDLLDRSSWTEVKKSGESLTWLDGAKFQFLDAPPSFLITLCNGREIGVDLQKLKVLRPSGAISGVDAVPPGLLDVLFDFTAGPRADAVETDAADETAALDEPLDEDVAGERDERAELIAELELPVDSAEVVQLEDGEAEQLDEELAPAQETEADEDLLAEELPPPADEVPLTEVDLGDVPEPDPAAPVDYVAWANSLIATDGPSAVPEFQAAVNRFARWEGAPELLKAAQAGDAAALASPEIQAWLAANQGALRHFRNGLALEYNGWPLKSDDGSLITATLPVLQPLRELSSAAVIEGRQYEAAGLPGSAAERYFDALAAGAQAGAGTTLIEGIVGGAIQRPAAEALLDLQAGPAGEQLDYVALAARLAEEYRSPRPLSETLQFERASFMDALQRMYSYEAETGKYSVDVAKTGEYLALFGDLVTPENSAAMINRLVENGFKRSVADGNKYYEVIADALTRPYAEAQQTIQRCEERLDSRASNPLLGGLSYYRYHQVRTKADAMQRATRLVTQLHAYRQEYGDYPDSLEVFGDADFAIDPFTGNSLNYQRSGDAFRLYSAGMNGLDDGGQHAPTGDTGDIVYWPRPKAQQPGR